MKRLLVLLPLFLVLPLTACGHKGSLQTPSHAAAVKARQERDLERQYLQDEQEEEMEGAPPEWERP